MGGCCSLPNTVPISANSVPIIRKHTDPSTSDEFFKKFLSTSDEFISDSVKEILDCLLAKYYIAMGRNDYFDNDGNGKFKLYCGEELFEEVLNDPNFFEVDYSPEYIDNCPILSDTEMDKDEQIMRILNHFHNIAENINYIKHNLSWSNISNIINFEFDENTCKSFRTILDEHKIDHHTFPKQDEIIQKMKDLQRKINLPQDQYVWLLYVINKFRVNINVETTQQSTD
eukprot:373978_1